MSKISIDDIQALMFMIDGIRSKASRDIQALRQDLFKEIEKFESYADLYTFVKHMSSTPEEFNESMLLAREAFFNKKT